MIIFNLNKPLPNPCITLCTNNNNVFSYIGYCVSPYIPGKYRNSYDILEIYENEKYFFWQKEYDYFFKVLSHS